MTFNRLTQFLAFLPLFFTAQVSKKISVEHFSNSYCSICAAVNPGFFTNLNAQTNYVHITYQPSAPYNSCLLYQHNPIENDARTNYYGIYGSTPRLVLNGNVVPANANYSSAAIFTPYTSQTTAIALKLSQVYFASDSIKIGVTIINDLSHNYSNVRLLVALSEDTVFYTGGNGETKHYNVFRKALSPITGQALILSTSQNDSLNLLFSAAVKSSWNPQRISIVAILQDDTNKDLIQAEKINLKAVTTGITNHEAKLPVCNYFSEKNSLLIRCDANNTLTNFMIYSLDGKLLEQLSVENNNQTSLQLPMGFYFVKCFDTNGNSFSKKILISE